LTGSRRGRRARENRLKSFSVDIIVGGKMSILIEGEIVDLHSIGALIYNNSQKPYESSKYCIITAEINPDSFKVDGDIPLIKGNKLEKVPPAENEEITLLPYVNLGKRVTTHFLYSHHGTAYDKYPVGKIFKAIRDARNGLRTKYIQNDTSLRFLFPSEEFSIDKDTDGRFLVELSIVKPEVRVENFCVPGQALLLSGKINGKQLEDFGRDLRMSTFDGDKKDDELAESETPPKKFVTVKI
jgi:hypothetical protein